MSFLRLYEINTKRQTLNLPEKLVGPKKCSISFGHNHYFKTEITHIVLIPLQ
jgi:hypothetical protein